MQRARGLVLAFGITIFAAGYVVGSNHGAAVLKDADREFARETASRGADGWADFFAEDGVMFPNRGRVDGRDAIRERMRPALAEGAPRLQWEPTEAVISAQKDLGYTLGRWQSVGRGVTGADSVLAQGNYVTIWRHVAGKGWRVAVDIGNSD